MIKIDFFFFQVILLKIKTLLKVLNQGRKMLIQVHELDIDMYLTSFIVFFFGDCSEVKMALRSNIFGSFTGLPGIKILVIFSY